MLGPEEFFEGLGLGLRSFLGAGVVGKYLEFSMIRGLFVCLLCIF